MFYNFSTPLTAPARSTSGTRSGHTLLFAALLAGLASPLAAQTAPPPAGSLPSRDTLEGQTAPPRAEPQRRVRVEGGEIERSPCALADPSYASIKFTPASFTFNNLGPVDAASLRNTYERYIGTEQSLSIICEVRDAAATQLRARGYIAAVQVPTQRIESGNVQLEVLYAKVTTVRVVGDAGRNEKVFERYLSRLANGQAFNRLEAERYLLLARDLPGHDVRLLLKPAGTGPGEMVAEVSVTRTKLALDFSLQNYAAPATGRWGGQLRAEAYGLTGMGDRTSLAFYSTPDFQEQQILQAGHDFLVGGQGLRLGARFTHAWTRPDVVGLAPVLARTAITSFDARYPVLRGQAVSLGLTAGLDLVTQRVSFNGAPLSRDRLNVGWLRLDGEALDMKGLGPDGGTAWRIAGNLELRRGFDIFSASPNCLETPIVCTAPGSVPPSLLTSDPTATLVRFSGRGELRLARHLVVALMPRGQYSNASLTAYEQFALGSFTLGRGFDPGVFTGDSGLGISAEVALPGLVLSTKHRLQAEPYVFGDAGWAWNKIDPLGQDPQRIVSLGAGVRANWQDRARLDMTLAVPVRSAGATRSGDVRLMVSLTTRLVPWSAR